MAKDRISMETQEKKHKKYCRNSITVLQEQGLLDWIGQTQFKQNSYFTWTFPILEADWGAGGHFPGEDHGPIWISGKWKIATIHLFIHKEVFFNHVLHDQESKAALFMLFVIHDIPVLELWKSAMTVLGECKDLLWITEKLIRKDP